MRVSCWTEPSKDTGLWERWEHGHAAAPHMSMWGASKAPPHTRNTGCTAWGAPDIKQWCWHSWEPCLHPPHPACHPPACQHAEEAPGEGEKQETGRKANTLQWAAASQWLLQGQLAALSLRLDLITSAPVPALADYQPATASDVQDRITATLCHGPWGNTCSAPGHFENNLNY